MTFDTLPTPVSCQTAALYLAKLDERGETYGFNVTSPTFVARGEVGPITLALYREGSDDPLTLTLNMDGTWTAAHVLTIGEKE